MDKTETYSLRNKIAEILRNYATQYGTWTSTYDYVDQILAFPEILNGLILLSEKLGDTVEYGREETYEEHKILEKCPAMTIEDCPWGKENVEFREIFLRGINRQLEGIKVEEKCSKCHGSTYKNLLNGNIQTIPKYDTCPICQGTSTIYRPATLEEIITWLKLFIPWCEQHPYYEISPDKQALILPSGGRLVLKK